MKTFTLRHRRDSSKDAELAPDESEEHDSSDDEGAPDLQWVGTGSTALITRALVAGLWVLVLVVPTAAAVFVAAGSQTPTTAQQAAPAETDINEQAAVSGFAEGFVATWLASSEGEEERLAPYLAAASTVTLPTRPWAVEDVATAGLHTRDNHLWSVTVAATVTDPGGRSTPTRRYFQVPVAYADGALAAQMLPAPVASPTPAVVPTSAYRYRVSPGEPLVQAAQEFLDALVTGRGDVARYTSPGSVIAPVDPTPYTQIEVDGVQVDVDVDPDAPDPQNGEQLHLLVTATATATSGKNGQISSPITVQYPLTMTARDGRWEVFAIDSMPATVPADPAASNPTAIPNP